MSENVFDYIIVGAGSAGCILANRLSANPGARVLLLEAGGKTHPLSRLPASYVFFIDKPGVNWRFKAEPEESTNGRAIPVPRGRMLGGSSAINGLVYVRGQPIDYDTWESLGNPGWGYDDLIPTFKRLEAFEHNVDGTRGTDGMLPVTESTDELPIYEALLRAADELGIARNPDYNGRVQEGFGTTQTTSRNGKRMSTAEVFLKPARKRPNLVVHTGALAHRLVLENKLCVGVEYDHRGQRVTAKARGEVILCAGSIGSPQLLELSGIGSPEVLEQQGIEVQHELPGVGENLRDHYAPRMAVEINGAKHTYNDQARGLGLVRQVFKYLFTARGFLSIPSSPLLAFIKSRKSMAVPDIQIHFLPYNIKSIKKRELSEQPGITFTYYQLRPESRGSVHIQSRDPSVQPAIRFNFLDHPTDRQCMIDGLHRVREIIETKALADMRGAWIKPETIPETDEDILQWIKANAETTYHPVGTCKMGNDAMAVVDANLRVHGISGLRVADGSIMPTLVSGNTNAACMMIGEKAAELVQAR